MTILRLLQRTRIARRALATRLMREQREREREREREGGGSRDARRSFPQRKFRIGRIAESTSLRSLRRGSDICCCRERDKSDRQTASFGHGSPLITRTLKSRGNGIRSARQAAGGGRGRGEEEEEGASLFNSRYSPFCASLEPGLTHSRSVAYSQISTRMGRSA